MDRRNNRKKKKKRVEEGRWEGRKEGIMTCTMTSWPTRSSSLCSYQERDSNEGRGGGRGGVGI